jgi:hypothetical protein
MCICAESVERSAECRVDLSSIHSISGAPLIFTEQKMGRGGVTEGGHLPPLPTPARGSGLITVRGCWLVTEPFYLFTFCNKEVK